MRLAHSVRIARNNGKFSTIEIDGEPFPWYLEDAPIKVDVDLTGIPIVTLRMLAENVEITDSSSD